MIMNKTSDEERANRKKKRTEYRERVFQLLGGRCKRCGEDDPRVLQVDHLTGAPETIRGYGRAGSGLYFQIATGKKPLTDFQLLCANCNWIKRHELNEHTAAHKQRGDDGNNGAPSQGTPEEHT